MRMLSFFLLLICADVSAETLYKHIDKDGKITYSDKALAKDAMKNTEKIETDSKRNVIAPLAGESGKDGAGNVSEGIKRRLDQQQKLRLQLDEASTRLSEAKDALASGMAPEDDEWRTVGAASGRAARIPNEAYHKRIKGLEDAVKDAEVKLAAAELAYRRGVPN